MPTRSLRWRGFSVSVSIPRRGESTSAASNTVGNLIFRDPPPTPQFKQRSIGKALAFREAAHEASRQQADQAHLSDDDFSKTVRGISWYHTIELPNGVVTPGQFDHRTLLPHYGFPASLVGKRALDVATFNGFWAFHMESLGADVTAIDLDNPADWDFPERVRAEVRRMGPAENIGDGFEVARAALDSSVKRIGRSVYDLNPAEDGTFDFVHCGDVLVHLREPLRALEAIRSVTTGQLLLSDGIDIDAQAGPYGPPMQYLGGWNDVVWWMPSLDGLAQLVIDAGFSDLHVNSVYNLAKTHETAGFWRVSLTATA